MKEKKVFQSLSAKAKLQYIWDYYKFPILGTAAAVGIVIFLLHHFLTYRDPLLNVIMINCNAPYGATEDGFYGFMEKYGYSSDKNNYISLTATMQFRDGADYTESYNDHYLLTTKVAAGNQDLFFGTGEVFLRYAEDGALVDLSTVLSEELLEKYKDNLIYSTDCGEAAPYPCAIEIKENEWLKKNNYYDTCYFGIFYDNQDIETCRQFAEFLLE